MRTYDLLTRRLHGALAVGVTVQMLVSLVMVTPRPDRVANFWFPVHETVGIVLFGVLLVYWLRVVARTLRGGEPLRLFPWTSPDLRAAVVADAKVTFSELSQFKLSDDEEVRPLVAAIQGIGLLIGAVLATTGLIAYLSITPGTPPSWIVHQLMELHESLGPLMWAYLVLHPAMAVLHHLAGQPTLKRMFGRDI